MADSSKRIAVFLGDFFWSSVPYDGLPLHDTLLNCGFECDLLMFEDDIRLNRKPDENGQFWLDPGTFRTRKNLRLLKTWDDLALASSDYSLIISSTHIAPKTRYPWDLQLGCPLAVWDVGGSDILTNTPLATYRFVKGPIWKDWLVMMGKKPDDVFVTGSPHFDGYSLDVRRLETFKLKHGLGKRKCVLVAPSNPNNHKEQLKQNIGIIGELLKRDVDVMVKTHPLDCLFNETEGPYTGVYRRPSGKSSQLEMLKQQFPDIKAVASYDHFRAMHVADALFNISGSHIAWETVFTRACSFSMNHSDKGYYGRPSYLHECVELPDRFVNTEVKSVDELFTVQPTKDMDAMARYILMERAVPKICAAIRAILERS